MKLHNILSNLIEAQNQFNAEGFANCFDINAIVFDDGEKHKGREAIKKWNEETNAKYETQLEVISYSETNKESILKVKGSGNFGSPIEFKYHFILKEGLIESLEIKG